MTPRLLLVFIAMLCAGAIACAGEARISFLPPPQEGTISLGIYDHAGKLVRVLEREAEIEAFEAGADSLVAKWDGKDDAGIDLPPGRYSARGFAVGEMKIEETSTRDAETLPASANVTVKLIANPLAPRDRRTVELAAAFDEDGSFMQTADGLPLFSVDECPQIFAVSLVGRGNEEVELVQTDGDTTDRFRISGVHNMMAFDAGEFELK